MKFAAIVAALLRDPEVASALREALASPTDVHVPLLKAAADLGMKPRALRDAARRGELSIEGPRNARLVRRSELDRYLRETAPRTRAPRLGEGADVSVLDLAAFDLAAKRLDDD